MRTILCLALVIQSSLSLAQSTPFKPQDKIYSCDSITQAYIEHLILLELNSLRKVEGAEPLRIDTLLRPAVMHHVKYMRLSGDMTHDETKDLENFTEYEWPTTRKHYLIDQSKIWKISEELINGIIVFDSEKYTYEKVIENTLQKGYKTCNGHWSSLMSPEYDCVYIYYDLNQKCHSHGAGIICTILLGLSSDNYKKEINE